MLIRIFTCDMFGLISDVSNSFFLVTDFGFAKALREELVLDDSHVQCQGCIQEIFGYEA